MFTNLITSAVLAVTPVQAGNIAITVDSDWLGDKTIEVCQAVGRDAVTNKRAVQDLVDYMNAEGVGKHEQLAVLAVCGAYMQGVVDGLEIAQGNAVRY